MATGYARMLAGDHDGALDDLHEAVRRDPRLVTTIVEDPDLAPLRGRDRFDRLPALAAEEEAAFHRRIRDAARPDGPLVPPDLPRATDLGTVVNVLNIGCRRVYVRRLEFDSCAELSHISIGGEAGSWTLILNGKLPQLREVRQDARPYGSFTSRAVVATPADTQAYKSMIKKGARYAKRW